MYMNGTQNLPEYVRFTAFAALYGDRLPNDGKFEQWSISLLMVFAFVPFKEEHRRRQALIVLKYV